LLQDHGQFDNETKQINPACSRFISAVGQLFDHRHQSFRIILANDHEPDYIAVCGHKNRFSNTLSQQRVRGDDGPNLLCPATLPDRRQVENIWGKS